MSLQHVTIAFPPAIREPVRRLYAEPLGLRELVPGIVRCFVADPGSTSRQTA